MGDRGPYKRRKGFPGQRHVARYSALFKRRTGYPPVEYLLRLRVLKACELLDTTPLSVKQVAGELGY